MATPNMGLTKPTENGSDGAWDTLLNALIDLIDAHDHSTGKGVTVKPAGMSFDANKSLANYRLTAVGSVGFTNHATGALLTGSGSYLGTLGVVANELSWVTTGGTVVALTSGAGLNTSLVGGIVGDYSTTAADVYYSDSLKAYKMLQNTSPDFYAAVHCGDLALFEKTSGIVRAVTMKSPAALAASYTVTWPAAVAGAGTASVLLMDESGTLLNSGNAKVTGTLLVTGTANLDAAAVVGGDLTVAGTVRFSATRYRYLPASAGQTNPTTGWTFLACDPSGAGVFESWYSPVGAGSRVTFHLPLRVGQRLTGVIAYVTDTNNVAGSISMEIGKTTNGTTVSQVGTTQTSAHDGTAQALTIGSLTEDVTGSKMYVVMLESVGGVTTTHAIHYVRCSYIDTPA